MTDPFVEEVATSLLTDDRRVAALRIVRDLALPEGAIAGDFVRCAVFDRLHRHPEATQLRVIEVVYCDPGRIDSAVDRSLEIELMARAARRPWQVRNLAALPSSPTQFEEALGRAFLDTASAVAARLTGQREELEVIAPWGLEDLVRGIVRPAQPEQAGALRRKVEQERWLNRFPQLRLLGLKPSLP